MQDFISSIQRSIGIGPGSALTSASRTGRSDLLVKLAIQLVAMGVSMVVVRYVFDQLDPMTRRSKNTERTSKVLLDHLMKNSGTSSKSLSKHEWLLAECVVDTSTISVTWDQIGGLNEVIAKLKELVILPFARPDLFGPNSKLLRPPTGVLLYGPPGCGKTMLAKAVAKESRCSFLSVKVSTLLEKWYGESQKLVDAMFSLAAKIAPCIVFIDEIDSFLRQRGSGDHESTAMMKAQFMTLWDGLLTSQRHGHVMIMGATNRPNDLDEAILRRMPARFHISLPDKNQRMSILKVMLESEEVEPSIDFVTIATATAGFSGSDLSELCRTAAMYAVRELLSREASSQAPGTLRARRLSTGDFLQAAVAMAQNKTDVALFNMPSIVVD